MFSGRRFFLLDDPEGSQNEPRDEYNSPAATRLPPSTSRIRAALAARTRGVWCSQAPPPGFETQGEPETVS